MTEITLRVADNMLALIELLAHHLNDVEIINVCDGTLAETEIDQCFRMAIMEMKEEHVIRRPRDYAWIMTSIEQHAISDLKAFESPQSFINYLRRLGIPRLPNRSTLSRAYNNVIGIYPDWTFLDEQDYNEVLRRKLVVVRFKSAFLKYKQAFCNNHCTK